MTIECFLDVLFLQSWRILVMGLQRLSGKDMARRVPVNTCSRCRASVWGAWQIKVSNCLRMDLCRALVLL